MLSCTDLPPLTSPVREWLVHLADPLGRGPRPAHDLSSEEVPAVLSAASQHGVLPAAIRGVADCTGGRAAEGRSEIASALATARESAALQAGLGLMLRHHGGRVSRAFQAANIEGAIVKGAVAATRLYSDPSLRTFTDVDVLVRATDRAAVSNVMRALGFELFTFPDRAGRDYEEDKWLLAGEPKVMVEVHTNLVHSPKLRSAMSVRYDDVLEAGDGDCAAPTALLFVASAHAAIGHQFDRLQHLVDILQGVRSAPGRVDVNRLRAAAARSGVLFPLVTAIELTGRVFRDPECLDLAHRLDPAYARCWRRLLIGSDVVADAQTVKRPYASWRRKLYRQCLKWASTRGLREKRGFHPGLLCDGHLR